MPDVGQERSVRNAHLLRKQSIEYFKNLIVSNQRESSEIGLVIPTDTNHIRLPSIPRIVAELTKATFIDEVVFCINNTNGNVEDYQYTLQAVAPLGERAKVLWLESDSTEWAAAQSKVAAAGVKIDEIGKGRALWWSIGLLLGNPNIDIIAMHDADNTKYDACVPAKLVAPIVMPFPTIDHVKAYYARIDEETDEMCGRVVRLLATPFIQALDELTNSNDDFVKFLGNWRYPFSGEMAFTRKLISAISMPYNFAIETHLICELFRHCPRGHICQVDLGFDDHVHQDVGENSREGLRKMVKQIVTFFLRHVERRPGVVLGEAELHKLQSLYSFYGIHAIDSYYLDARINGLTYSRQKEQQTLGHFTESLREGIESFRNLDEQEAVMPPWCHIYDAAPDVPKLVRQVVEEDARKHPVASDLVLATS